MTLLCVAYGDKHWTIWTTVQFFLGSVALNDRDTAQSILLD
jgi:hypothetical protein